MPNTYSLATPKKLLKWSNDGSGFASLFEMIRDQTSDGKQTLILFDNLSALMQGQDTMTADLDLIELLNNLTELTEDSSVSVSIGINRDLLFGNQKPVYREIKRNDFDYIFDVNRNSGGYNHRDVHGQMSVILNQ